MKKLFAITIVAAFCAGCAFTRQYTIKFDSDPSGAKVLMSSGALRKTGAADYLGTTPCTATITATITGTKQGYFIAPKAYFISDYAAGVVKFTFEPPSGETNLFSHTQSYRTKTDYVEGDKIPQGIYFDLTKP